MKSCSRSWLVCVITLGAIIQGCALASNPSTKISAASASQHSRKNVKKSVYNSGDSLLESKVAQYIKPYIDTRNFNGSILIGRKGEILFSKGYGYSNIEQRIHNSPHTVFHLASVSRIFTSAAILLLEQRGKLSVEDKLSKYLSDWPRGDEITIHHLLTLSAGFPNINSLEGYETWSKSPQTPATLCEKFRDLPLEFAPGTKSVHSNSNYNVLALLIEKLSNKTYGDFLMEEMFAPLDMTQTAHDDHSNQIVPHEAIGYKPVGLARMSKTDALDWSVKTGNGSLYSTTEDLYKFDRMLVDHALLNKKSVTMLFTEHFPHNGYGWFIRDRYDTTTVFINGRSPGFGSAWIRAVDPDVTVIVLGNLYNSVPTQIGLDLLAMTLGKSIKPVLLSHEPPDPSLLAEIVGSYQFGPNYYVPNGVNTFHIKDGHLFDQYSQWLIPAGGMKFVHRMYWSDLEFLRDESGKVVKLRYDNFVGVKQDLEDSDCQVLVNGQWFDSERFSERTVYVTEGEFSSQKPCEDAQVVDLGGGYVVPPYGEGHHHTLAFRAASMGKQFIQDGIFYAKIMAVTARAGAAARKIFNSRDTVDVSLAMAGITAPNAHPSQIVLRMGQTLDQIEGEWVHTITTREDLDRKWPRVLNTNPDFVKVFLVNSEEYDQRKENPQVAMRYRGMDPRLVGRVVELAHQADLQVAAHVRTAADFHVALAAGVDIIAHLPGFDIGPTALEQLSDERLLAELDDPGRFTISDEDARLAGERGVVVVTTIGTLGNKTIPVETPLKHRSLMAKSIDVKRTVHQHNLSVLKRHHVKIAIGSDRGEGSVIDDIFYLESLEVFTLRELLTMFVETTPQMIFPDRKIGLLRDGYEASFLVLEGNPLEALDNVRRVKLRYKQGEILTP